jgi:cobalt-zinc-cadmium resistance protein CzcA
MMPRTSTGPASKWPSACNACRRKYHRRHRYTPELGPISTGLGEIYQYVVRPEEGYEGSNMTPPNSGPSRIGSSGGNCSAWKAWPKSAAFGGKLKQYEIAVHPSKLQSYNITINDVFSAVEKNNQNTQGARISRKGPSVLFIRSEGLIGSKEDIENIFIKTTVQRNPAVYTGCG